MDYGQKISEDLNRQNVFFEGALSEGAGSNSLGDEKKIAPGNVLSTENDLNSGNFMPGNREAVALGRAGIDALNSMGDIARNTQMVFAQDESPSTVTKQDGQVSEVSAIEFSKSEEINKKDIEITEKAIDKMRESPSEGYEELSKLRQAYVKSSFGREIGKAA